MEGDSQLTKAVNFWKFEQSSGCGRRTYCVFSQPTLQGKNKAPHEYSFRFANFYFTFPEIYTMYANLPHVRSSCLLRRNFDQDSYQSTLGLILSYTGFDFGADRK
ncbi:unnamed protein product [Sphenostylis stenocarpa]|uniref:Uncharacterized protein n=1 Tax=Sphenostylis stenocarpa TaxID=92480 RepID=A0AA86W637_9FABA|nr:unnamed protein product [Sphenostylis stenocarpa]